MPNKDWYWDRFGVDLKSGQLDLSDAQTSALSADVEGRADYTDDRKVKYETRFIDELYGTDERAWAGEKAPYDDGTGRGTIGNMGTGRGGKTGNWEKPEHVTWGLDLVRDWSDHDFKRYPVGSDEHYEHQTRGKVDWAHYYDDNAYQSAFKDYRNERNVGPADNFSNLKDFLLDRDQDGSGPDDRNRVDFLEYAKTHTAEEERDGGLRDTWDNQYVDQFDPETAPDYQATYLDVPDLWGAAEGKSDWETPETPISVVKPASLPTLDSINRRQVEVPDSIKHFGEAKSAPTGSFTAGGQPSGGLTPPPPTTQGGN